MNGPKDYGTLPRENGSFIDQNEGEEDCGGRFRRKQLLAAFFGKCYDRNSAMTDLNKFRIVYFETVICVITRARK